MMSFLEEKRFAVFSKVVSSFVVLTFMCSVIIPPSFVQAQMVPQTVLNLPVPGTMIPLTNEFMPAMIKGITVDPANPLHFNFIMDLGEQGLEGGEVTEEGTKLIKYFLASLTVPDKEMWVNLSPYEEGRIISNGLGETEMGRDLLAQDYLLKQLSSSLMYPEKELGSSFWQKIYKEAYEKYHTTDIPVDTFNKVWIVPSKATVYEHGTSAFVVERHLKVMLEEDYLAMTKSPYQVEGNKNSELVTKVIREVIIPAIEKEINEGENFASLRQIYNSMILATWFKRSLKESLLGKLYVDQNKVMGVDVEDKEIKTKIYNQYIDAFKKGVYNYIREDYDPMSREVIPRKYFSGGLVGVPEQTYKALPQGTDLTAEQRAEAPDGVNEVDLDVDLLEETGSGVNLAAVKKIDTTNVIPGSGEAIVGKKKDDFALSTQAQQHYTNIQQRFNNLIKNGEPMVRPMAKKFASILEDKMALLPFYMKLSGKSEEEIVRDILEYTYEPNVKNLEGMNEHLQKGEINVAEAKKIRTSKSDPIVQVNLKEGETLNPLVWPLKGDPWQSGHIWMGYESLNKFALDIFIPTVDDSDPTRKPNLSSLMLRGPETDNAYELYGDLVKRENLMRDYPDLLTADGERVIFTFMRINQHIPMNLHYGAGSDHANIFALKKKVITVEDFIELYDRYAVIKDQASKDQVKALLEEKGILSNGEFNRNKLHEILDTLRLNRYLSDDYKLYTKKDVDIEDKKVLKAYHFGENTNDLAIEDISSLGITEEVLRDFIYHVFVEPDVPTKIMFHMLDNTEGFQDLENKEQVSIIFNQRIGDEVPTEDLEMYQAYVNERLQRANKGLKPIALLTTSQPLDISSTEIRELGYHWKMPFNIAQIADAFEMWSFQTEESQARQQQMGADLFNHNVETAINSGTYIHGDTRASVVKKVKSGIGKLKGFGLNEFDKLVASRLINLREGAWGGKFTETRKQNFYDWFNELREVAENRAKELVKQGLKNPLPIRKKDQSILRTLIENGEMDIPVGMVKYIEQTIAEKGGVSPQMLVNDLGLTESLSETIVNVYKLTNLLYRNGLSEEEIESREIAISQTQVYQMLISAKEFIDPNLTDKSLIQLFKENGFNVVVKGASEKDDFALTVEGRKTLEAAGLLEAVEEKPIGETVPVKFGTSGHRGQLGKNFDIELVRRLSQGTSEYYAQHEPGKIVYQAYDTREGNPVSARETASILAGNGIKSKINTAPTPTPVVTVQAANDKEAAGVINHTASHSPAEDLGFKISPDHGGAAPKAMTDEATELANARKTYEYLDYDKAKQAGLIEEISQEQAVQEYVYDYVIPNMKKIGAWDDIVNFLKNNPQFTLILDPMQGTGVAYMEAVYSELAKASGRDDLYQMINTDNTDPKFKQTNGAPRPDSAPYNQGLIDAVTAKENALGLSVDGDMDRFGFVDFGGQFIPANDMVGLLAYFLKNDVGLDGELGTTIATSGMVKAVADLLKTNYTEVDVGFKWFVDLETKHKAQLEAEGKDYTPKFLVAGEVSAHVAVAPFMKSFDDGLAIGLMGLWMVARSGKGLAEFKDMLEQKIGKKFYMKEDKLQNAERTDAIKEGMTALLNQTLSELKAGTDLQDLYVVKEFSSKFPQDKVVGIKAGDGVKLYLESGAWVLMRNSGTEPIVKLTAEVTYDYDGELDVEGMKNLFKSVREVVQEYDYAMPTALDRKNPTTTKSWKKLQSLSSDVSRFDLRAPLKDPERLKKLGKIFNDKVFVDFSKNLIDDEVLEALVELADEIGVGDAIEKMFSGEKINETEGRAVLHVALRNITRDADGNLVAANGPIMVDGKDVMPGVIKVLNQMKGFIEKLHSGEWRGATGKKIKHVVNIGIGGSDLGPKMASDALKPYQQGDIEVHYVSNIDGTAAAELMKKLDPEETLVIIASKSFTTQETMQNANTFRNWMLEHYNGDESVIEKHFVAVSTAEKLVSEFGINTDNMFEFWDWVGGRYSVWSAIGLSTAAYIGFDNFIDFLEGGREADEHFRQRSFENNIAVLKALLNVWYGNFLGAESFAILPYDQYMHLFPAFAQQFFMESNGKTAARDGSFVDYNTGLIAWGAAGTDGQHSFYQLIHQGSRLVPADFIGIKRTHNALPGHNTKLYANFIAQTEALAKGATKEEVKAMLEQDPKFAGKDIDWEASQRTFAGNKPTTSILVDQVTPRTLGNLVALYEHQIFTEGVIWNIFSFDQWGVQLGKKVADNDVLPYLEGRKSLEELKTSNLSEAGKKMVRDFIEANGDDFSMATKALLDSNSAGQGTHFALEDSSHPLVITVGNKKWTMDVTKMETYLIFSIKGEGYDSKRQVLDIVKSKSGSPVGQEWVSQGAPIKIGVSNRSDIYIEKTTPETMIISQSTIEDLAATTKFNPQMALDILSEIQKASPDNVKVTTAGAMDLIVDENEGLKISPRLAFQVEKVLLQLKEQGLATEGKTDQGFKLFTLTANSADIEAAQIQLSDEDFAVATGANGEYGGINLDPNLLDLTIKRDGKGIPLPISDQVIENIHIEGFIPVIINVTPITNLPLMLGMSESENPFASNKQKQDKPAERTLSSNVSRDPMDFRGQDA